MFIETSNGNLINASYIKMIYVTIPTNEDPLCSVKAKTEEGKEISIYRDKELQYCQEYLNNLKKKIAIEMR